jgi:hypothetical protein
MQSRIEALQDFQRHGQAMSRRPAVAHSFETRCLTERWRRMRKDSRLSSFGGLLPLFLLSTLLLGGTASCTGPHTAGRAAPTASHQPQAERNAAGWADLEAERRMTDGDYDGAVQANQQAAQARRKAQNAR